ncbi:hypothetical protein [Nannocystis bainbridge]|uniref:Uncharacterized protein n=1 Tax=Nannocystis bainbridge TaxID=2995303 RepID=A0ABT5E0X9_9BACT|nr:hypothetical protein [Nannocystis bainbridge]MDC0719512.1 hypothetical protein [Nannocystis bainbridge]
MASGPSLLESIPKLVAARDAAALVALQDHDDKQVRKAARKAIHTLRSKGVTIPEAETPRGWSAGDLNDLRGDMAAVAVVDTESTPGLSRVMISAPQEERSYLWVAAISGRDQIVDFATYVQTDGQRTRMIRDWDRGSERRVPADWARARIRWAREQTLTSGFAVPRQLDDMLVHLGEAPVYRPASFLDGVLPPVDFAPDKDNVIMSLANARVNQWPPVIDVEPMMRRVNEKHPDLNDQSPEDDRYTALLDGARGDETLRADLKAQVANLLEDAAVTLWLGGNDVEAAKVRVLASEIRASAEPEALPWIGRLLGFQIASTFAYLSRQQQLGQ